MKKLSTKPFGYYCSRCGTTYLSPTWPAPGACARCAVGVADFHHDLPLGFVCVTS